jgi:hypothetical protein
MPREADLRYVARNHLYLYGSPLRIRLADLPSSHQDLTPDQCGSHACVTLHLHDEMRNLLTRAAYEFFADRPGVDVWLRAAQSPSLSQSRDLRSGEFA